MGCEPITADTLHDVIFICPSDGLRVPLIGCNVIKRLASRSIRVSINRSISASPPKLYFSFIIVDVYLSKNKRGFPSHMTQRPWAVAKRTEDFLISFPPVAGGKTNFNQCNSPTPATLHPPTMYLGGCMLAASRGYLYLFGYNPISSIYTRNPNPSPIGVKFGFLHCGGA